MKRIVLISISLIICFFAYANERVILSCIYHKVTVLDRDNAIVDDMPSSNGDPIGLFLLAEVDGTKFISVTMARETLYEIQVGLSKEVNESGIRTEVYGGIMQFQGQNVPIQVFVFYNKSGAPDEILIDVFNSPTCIVLSGLVKTRN